MKKQLWVENAMNGQECIDMFSSLKQWNCNWKNYDIILMDLNMPLVDGFSASQ